MCQLPIGVLLDKFGVKRVGRVGIFLWSVASFAAAGTPNLGGLFAARFLLAWEKPPRFQPMPKPSGSGSRRRSAAWPRRSLTRAQNSAQPSACPSSALRCSSPAGAGASLLPESSRSPTSLLLARIQRSPGRPELSATELAFIHRAPLSSVSAAPPAARPRSASFSCAARCSSRHRHGAYNYVFYLLLTWLPSYLSFALHIDLLHSFSTPACPGFRHHHAVGIGGWLVDFLVKRGFSATRVRKVVLVGGTAFGLGILGAAHAHSATQALLWISISIAVWPRLRPSAGRSPRSSPAATMSARSAAL